MTSPTVDLLEGVAGILVDAGLGVYRPDGDPYTSEETGIALNTQPDAPDRMIVLTDYLAIDDPYPTASGLIGFQIRTRAGVDPREEVALRDDIARLLHNLENRWFGSIHVAVLLRKSVAPGGQDVKGRWDYTSNYYATVDYPPTANRPD